MCVYIIVFVICATLYQPSVLSVCKYMCTCLPFTNQVCAVVTTLTIFCCLHDLAMFTIQCSLPVCIRLIQCTSQTDML